MNATETRTYDKLTAALNAFLPTLGEERRTIVANYYRSGTVRVGFHVDHRAERHGVTSANNVSPVDNVAARLID